MDVIACEGPSNLRQKLVYATLSGKVLRVNKIREKDERPGLQPHEASLLRLMEKITNGSLVEISETGTSLRYKPGIICGGANLRHDCGKARAIGYFLEPLVLLSAGYPLPLELLSAGYPLLGQGELLRGEPPLRLQLLEQCGVVPGEG